MHVSVNFHSFFSVCVCLFFRSLCAFCLPIFSTHSHSLVISVYCFLYIFQLERTKSYSNASQATLRSMLLLPCPAPALLPSCSPFLMPFVCVMSLFCALPADCELNWASLFYMFSFLPVVLPSPPLTDGCHCEWAWHFILHTYAYSFCCLHTQYLNAKMFQ